MSTNIAEVEEYVIKYIAVPHDKEVCRVDAVFPIYEQRSFNNMAADAECKKVRVKALLTTYGCESVEIEGSSSEALKKELLHEIEAIKQEIEEEWSGKVRQLNYRGQTRYIANLSLDTAWSDI